MTNDTSKSPVKGIMVRADTEVDGSPAKTLASGHVTDWSFSIPHHDRHFIWWWEVGAKIRHLFGRHSFIDLEIWTISDYNTIVRVTEQICWLCPVRRSVL